MENEVKIFKNHEFGKIRTVGIDGNPWFVGKDVAVALGYENPTKAIRDHVDEEDKKAGVKNVTPSIIDSLGRKQYPTLITKSGVYSLVFRSKAPVAKAFLRWVEAEVMAAVSVNSTPEPVAAEGLTALSYKGNNVRMQMINGEPWWVLADVCDVLELSTPAKVAGRLDDDEKGVSQIHTLGGMQNMTIINEPGLYDVIMRSDKPEAKEFKRWVTHEVLPSIRKTGGYVNDDELFIETYLPFAEDGVKDMFRMMLLSNRQATDLVRKQQAQLEEQMPKVVFADIVQKSVDNIYMADMAKLLCEKGVKTGQKRLYNLLRNVGVLQANNVPYQRYIDQDYFKVKESYYEDPKGRVHLTQTTLVTPRGQVWLANNVPKWMEQLGM